ncbi:hypothetical protein [Paenibacillus sp. GCM10027626]|uniref:hypothetical protein n=1 Tax=Paenibacillus sp. GCM10027626 TaxID=3273411 RepID=UPI003631A6B6
MIYIYSVALLIGGLIIINLIFGYQSKHIDPQFWSTMKFQLMLLPLFFIANLCIGYGVKFGVKAFHSLAFILITAKCMEVLISVWTGYLFMKEVPSWKTWAGLVVIGAGLVLVKQK